jgi:MFS family permease
VASTVERSATAGRTPLRLLYFASFISSFDRFMMAPMLVSIAAELHGSVEDVSQAAAVYFLCYGIAQVGWAQVSDRLGRIRTLRLALTIAAIAGAASAAVPDIGWLVVARGVAGGTFAAAIPSTIVYIGDTVPVRVRQASLTDMITSTSLGIAVATVASGAIAEFATWRVAFALSAVVAGVLAVVMRGLTEPALPPRTSVLVSARAVLGNRVAQLVLLLAMFEGMVLLGTLTFLPATLHATGLSVTVAGLLTAAYGVAVLLFARLVKRRSKVSHPANLILVGGGAATVAYLLLTIDHRAVPVVVATVLIGAGWAFMHSTMQTWATDMAPAARATAVSLFAAALFTGSAISTAVLGPLVDGGRFQLAFLLSLAVAAPLTVIATIGRRRYRTRGHVA